MKGSEPPRAACAGLWWLFDSKDLASHVEARKICASCPIIDACDNILSSELKRFGGAPEGTWAGKHVGIKKKRTGNPREHGTMKGYYQHKNRKETACAECRAVCTKAMDARLQASA